MASYTSSPVKAFTGMLGVAVSSFMYNDGLYANSNISNVETALSYLGVKSIRDQIPDSMQGAGGNAATAFAGATSSINSLAALGYTFTLIVDGRGGDFCQQKLSRCSALQQTYSGSVVGIEGPNEVNNNSTGWGGWTTTFPESLEMAGLIGYQRMLFAGTNNNSFLSPVPVYDFTGGRELGGVQIATGDLTFDYANMHPYPNGGENDLTTRMTGQLAYSYDFTPTQVGITEFGYPSMVTMGTGTQGVDPTRQAYGILNGWAAAFWLGYESIYIYQLVDAYSSGAGYWGLFNYVAPPTAWTPKLSATAIHNTMAILADIAGSATGETLTITYTGAPSTMKEFLLQKSNGTSELVIFNEIPFWNPASGGSPITNTPTNVTVTLPASYTTINVYDATVGTTPTSTGSGSSIVVPVSDHMTILEFHN